MLIASSVSTRYDNMSGIQESTQSAGDERTETLVDVEQCPREIWPSLALADHHSRHSVQM